MRFYVTRHGEHALRDETSDELITYLLQLGHERVGGSAESPNFILNLTEAEHPRAGRRNSRAVFIVSMLELPSVTEPHDELRKRCYAMLIRTLSNLLITIHGTGADREIYFTTPEAGFYRVPAGAVNIYEHILPIVSSEYVIENEVREDLPDRLIAGSTTVDEIRTYTRELDELGVLPVPFPIRDVLGEDDMRHLLHIYGMTGLSYGNMSARESVPELSDSAFWMTGRGVDKRNLRTIGKDVLLVTGVQGENAIRVSSPAAHDPNARVSIDAVEHEMIYRRFPGIGAIVHVHAWMQNVRATRQNFPCGTRQLAEEVTRLLEQSREPEQTAIGLKNHGLTITGPTLADIFDRIRGHLRVEVPMFA